METTLGRSVRGRTQTPGRAERAGDAADRARVVGGVEELQRPLHLEVGVGGDGAHLPRPARRLVLAVFGLFGGRRRLLLHLARALAPGA